jgi:hypothetical protein
LHANLVVAAVNPAWGNAMVTRKKEGGLTYDEVRVVKAMRAKGERVQDIQALLNIGRIATINGSRISGVDHIDWIDEASPDEVEFFKKRKEAYDLQTGLNLYDDERLIRAREAMIRNPPVRAAGY